ncbi:MAG: SDR family oxidoreductase [Betaproteobacteria bacterium]|jgi:NAD(P)-dependent dehydrogenase (short-subunit alcohol dehydrogenase family)|nr:SDR family oxidoreductase [Betaproteobacteria bacterium]
MDLQLSGKVVVVTGGGRGHGESMSLALADEGAKVVVLDVNGENARNVQERIAQRGCTGVGHQVDITQMPRVEEVMRATKERFGRIDVLVNNACAAIRRVPFLEMDVSEWDQVIAVNLRGAFNCSQAAARIMKEQGDGRMINISSFAAGLPAAGFAAYSASKAGLEALSKIVSGELGAFGVTAVFVRPGVVETEFTKPGHAGQVGEKMRSAIASGRFGETDELARLICFLASPLSSYINGGPVPIDGGKYVCQF